MSDPRVMGIGAKSLTGNLSAGLAKSVSAPQEGKGFAQTLKDSMDKVGQMQQTADKSIQDLAVGRGESLHETMIAVEQAGIAFKMMMAVRGKVLNAYHEVMRMQF